MPSKYDPDHDSTPPKSKGFPIWLIILLVIIIAIGLWFYVKTL